MIRHIFLLLASATIVTQAAALGPKALDVDDPAATKAPAVEFRANQINRCVDAGGRVKLQDTPCSPTSPVPTVAASAASAADVVDLSALPPRALDKAGPPTPRQPATDWTSFALSLAWKVALFLAVAYAIFRLVRNWRESYALRAALAEAPRRTR